MFWTCTDYFFYIIKLILIFLLLKKDFWTKLPVFIIAGLLAIADIIVQFMHGDYLAIAISLVIFAACTYRIVLWIRTRKYQRRSVD